MVVLYMALKKEMKKAAGSGFFRGDFSPSAQAQGGRRDAPRCARSTGIVVKIFCLFTSIYENASHLMI